MNAEVKKLWIIRSLTLLFMVVMFLGYRGTIRTLPELSFLGLDKYFERSSTYLQYLNAIFIWLTPLVIASSGFFLTFNWLRRTIARATEVWNNLPSWIFWIFLPIVFSSLASWTVHDVTGAVPRIFDAFNYHFQARNFALGHFFAQEPPLPDLFRFPFIIIENGKWYGSVYPGYSILLAIGVRFGLDWIVNPVLGGIGLSLIYLASREMLGEKMARIVSLLGLLSPFFRMMSSIFMSHASGIVWVSLGLWMLWRWSAQGRSTSLWTPFWAGIASGWLYITRPQAGVVTLAGMFLFMMWKTRLGGKKRLLVFLLPLLCAIIFLGVYNQHLTGDFRINPRYYVDPDRRLGFGENLGEPLQDGTRGGHNLSRGFQNITLLFTLWNAEMFGWGSWGILGWMTVVILCALIGERKNPLTWILLSSILFNAGLYLFYFTPSPNFGPRYFAEIIPCSLILFVSGLKVLHAKLPAWFSYRGQPVGLILLVGGLSMIMIFISVPLQNQHYGVLPLAMKRSDLPEPEAPAVILIPNDLYCMNIYTWNSPDLSGNIFIPRKDGVSIQRVQEAFPERRVFQLERSDANDRDYSLTEVDEGVVHSL